MGRNGGSKLPGFQKYEEHEKRGLGGLTIELGKLETIDMENPKFLAR